MFTNAKVMAIVLARQTASAVRMDLVAVSSRLCAMDPPTVPMAGMKELFAVNTPHYGAYVRPFS